MKGLTCNKHEEWSSYPDKFERWTEMWSVCGQYAAGCVWRQLSFIYKQMQYFIHYQPEIDKSSFVFSSLRTNKTRQKRGSQKSYTHTFILLYIHFTNLHQIHDHHKLYFQTKSLILWLSLQLGAFRFMFSCVAENPSTWCPPFRSLLFLSIWFNSPGGIELYVKKLYHSWSPL